MTSRRINRIAARILVALSLLALLTVLSGYALPRHPAPVDENAQAHIFQFAVLAFLSALLLFLATADWSRPSRNARPLALPAAALMSAFAALYCLEHYWFF
ncbi:MAG: hypothetical protein ACR2IF_01075 [Terriglobales bacterium]